MSKITLCLAFQAFLVFQNLPDARAAERNLIAESGPAKVNLLEVFSSEGCSSCPPGEKWVSGLLEHSGLWRDFAPIVWHVDYWDYLGWADPFASERHSDRQRAYAARWRSRSVYTPGYVLNGREWHYHQDLEGLQRRENGGSGALRIERSGGGDYRIIFKPEGAATGRWTAHAVLLGSGITSRVLRGENAGRTLRHDFTVLDHAAGRMTGDPDSLHKVLRLKAPAGLLRDYPASDLAVTAWVTLDDDPAPVQAAAGPLV